MNNVKRMVVVGATGLAVMALAGCGMVQDAVGGAVEDAVEKGVEKAIEQGAEGDGSVDLGTGGDSADLPADLPAWLPIAEGRVALSVTTESGSSFAVASTPAEFDRVVADLAANSSLTLVADQDLGGLKNVAYEGDGYSVMVQLIPDGDNSTINYVVAPLTS